jgi:hypothetical protein
MHKKEKNIIEPADADNLNGSIEGKLKASSACDSADYKTGGSYSALSRKLYILILIGLCAAVILLLTGFGLDFFNGAGSLSLGSLQEHALNPDFLIAAIKNNQMPASLIISYAGLLAIILVPAAGLIYILGYFMQRKKYNLALSAAGVLFILILSAVIGLLK